MSEQWREVWDRQLEHHRLVQQVNSLSPVGEAMLAMEAERDRLCVELAAERERAEAQWKVSRDLAGDLLVERERAAQAEAGDGRLRVALTKIRQTDYGIIDDPYPDMSSEACFRCETMHEIADAALATDAGREWLEAADSVNEAADGALHAWQVLSVRIKDSPPELGEAWQAVAWYEGQLRDALARWSAVRGRG